MHELASIYIILHKVIRDFPKLEKFSIGVTIEKTLLECMESCFLATTYPRSKEKFYAIAEASAKFDTLKLFIRITINLKCISEETYTKLIPNLAKIGNMLGGWLKEGQKFLNESKS